VSFPPVPSIEITKDGRNLSPAWVAFFSQVFSNGGISAAAVNSGTPTFSGNVTVATLTATGAASFNGAAGFASTVSFNGAMTANNTATFNGPVTANSTASFAGPVTFQATGSVAFSGGFTSTTGTFTSSITGTTMTLSGLATFKGGATGTDAAFTTATIGGLSYNVEDISSTGAGGNPGQLSFYTRDADNLVSVLALFIDNQQRLNFYGANVDGTPPDLGSPINWYQQSRIYRDIQTFIGGTQTYGVSNYYGENTLRATRAGITYTYGVSVWINGGMVEGTNVTISEKLALVTAADNVNFANAFYVGSGSGSVATSNALGAFVSQGVLGYGKDAFANSPGGAVTQTGSKSNGVTLNKGCGAITMNNAALNAGASVEFVLTNSFIAATDTVICNMGPGGTASTYLVQAQAVAAGSCRFRVTNYSGTSRSEACVVNFAIIKAVNA